MLFRSKLVLLKNVVQGQRGLKNLLEKISKIRTLRLFQRLVARAKQERGLKNLVEKISKIRTLRLFQRLVVIRKRAGMKTLLEGLCRRGLEAKKILFTRLVQRVRAKTRFDLKKTRFALKNAQEDKSRYKKWWLDENSRFRAKCRELIELREEYAKLKVFEEDHSHVPMLLDENEDLKAESKRKDTQLEALRAIKRDGLKLVAPKECVEVFSYLSKYPNLPADKDGSYRCPCGSRHVSKNGVANHIFMCHLCPYGDELTKEGEVFYPMLSLFKASATAESVTGN